MMPAGKHVRLLRAITSALMRRLLVRILLVVESILGALVLLVVVLGSSVNGWWFVSLALLVPIGLVVAVLGGVLWVANERLAPHKLSRDDQKRLVAFVDKILGVVGRVRVPYPVLIALVAKDVLRGKESRFLKGIIEDSHGLGEDFVELQRRVG